MSRLSNEDREYLDSLGIKDSNSTKNNSDNIRKRIEKQEREKKERLLRRKKRVKRFKIFLVCFIILLIIFTPIFLFTDLSKIKSVKITGNSKVKISVIQSLLDIKVNETFIFFSREKTKKILYQDPYIKNIDIKQNFFYNIVINIKEREEDFIFKEKDKYYITGDDLIFIRETNELDKDCIVFEDFNILKTIKSKKIKTKDSYLLNEIKNLCISFKKNNIAIKKIIYKQTFPFIYLTDTLYLEGRPAVISKQISKLKKVLKKLESMNKKVGRLIIARDNYFSFKDETVKPKKTDSSDKKADKNTDSAINDKTTKEAVQSTEEAVSN